MTFIFIGLFILFGGLGVIGFWLNSSTPIQVGPLPFFCFAIAAVMLVVVIARLA